MTILNSEEGQWSEGLSALRKLVENLGTELRAADDWPPLLLMESNRAECAPALIALPPFTRGGQSKNALASFIRSSLISYSARSCATVATSWSLSGPNAAAELEKYGRVGDCPNCKEVLQLFLASYGGADHGMQSCMADVLRSDGPPRLANWIVFPRSFAYQGRFPETIYATLAEINR